MKPTFQPKQGVGATYKDRQGKTWKYTSQGWQEVKTDNIKEDVNKKGTFQMQPGEETDIDKLKTAGLDDAAISQVMTERRQILQKSPESTQQSFDNQQAQMEEPLSTVFGRMSKQEVVRYLIDSGVSNKKTIEEIEWLYDKAMGITELTPEEKKRQEFAWARETINLNPDSSKEELTAIIREKTSLDATSINALIGSQPKQQLGINDIRERIKSTLSEQKDLFTKAEAKTTAENELRTALGLKSDQTLPKSFQEAINDSIDEVYGKSLIQRIFNR